MCLCVNDIKHFISSDAIGMQVPTRAGSTSLITQQWKEERREQSEQDDGGGKLRRSDTDAVKH